MALAYSPRTVRQTDTIENQRGRRVVGEGWNPHANYELEPSALGRHVNKQLGLRDPDISSLRDLVLSPLLICLARLQCMHRA
jgi:hypothetical protein